MRTGGRGLSGNKSPVVTEKAFFPTRVVVEKQETESGSQHRQLTE